MKLIKIFFYHLLVFFVVFWSLPAYADLITRDMEIVKREAEICESERLKFAAFLRKMRADITRMSHDHNYMVGTLTVQSLMVWKQDGEMLSHFFGRDFNAVTHKEDIDGEKCKSVIEYYKGCYTELFNNVTAPISVRIPTEDKFPCLGKLYKRYDLKNPDHRFHGQ